MENKPPIVLNVLPVLYWPVFSCPSLAGFGCPPKNAEIVIKEWIETANELGRAVPEPKGRLMFA